MADEILTLRDGRRVSRADYVRAKTADLREDFHGLTEEHVDGQVAAILEGRDFGEGISTIGMFVKDDLCMEDNKDA